MGVEVGGGDDQRARPVVDFGGRAEPHDPAEGRRPVQRQNGFGCRVVGDGDADSLAHAEEPEEVPRLPGARTEPAIIVVSADCGYVEGGPIGAPVAGDGVAEYVHTGGRRAGGLYPFSDPS